MRSYIWGTHMLVSELVFVDAITRSRTRRASKQELDGLGALTC